MSKSLSNFDLNNNQLLNFVMQLLAAAPGGVPEGFVYYNSVEKKAYQYKGATIGWQPMGDVNVIESVKVNGVALTVTDKAVNVPVPVASNSTPSMDGSAAAGSSEAFARSDHVHPHDSDKLDKAGGSMSGAIAMGMHKITGLEAGSADGDAVNYGQMMTAIRENAGIPRGSFATKAALDAVAWQTTNPSAAYYVTNNDYAIVLADETHNNETWRYIYATGTGWQPQYRINETPFTQAQLDAINSGITAALVAQIGAGAAKTATGTISTSATSATVNFSGTYIGSFATMNGSKVIVDEAIGSSSVTFSTAAAPSAAVTCTVVYI